MISNGILISAIGLSMVFIIFVILIIAMNATSGIVAFLDKKFPEQSTAAEVKAKAAKHSNNDTSDDALVAIAIAATNHFKNGGSIRL